MLGPARAPPPAPGCFPPVPVDLEAAAGGAALLLHPESANGVAAISATITLACSLRLIYGTEPKTALLSGFHR